MIGFFISYFLCGFLLCAFVIFGWLTNKAIFKRIATEAAKDSGWSVDWIVTVWLILYLTAWPYILIAYAIKARNS